MTEQRPVLRSACGRAGVLVSSGSGERQSAPHLDEDDERFPMIRRSYRPGVDLDERLRRVFALVSLAPDGDADQRNNGVGA